MKGAQRCPAVHPQKGIQCGLPLRHGGRHQNGNDAPPWDDRELLSPEEIEMLYGTVAKDRSGTP